MLRTYSKSELNFHRLVKYSHVPYIDIFLGEISDTDEI